jgi:hypothetical protein
MKLIQKILLISAILISGITMAKGQSMNDSHEVIDHCPIEENSVFQLLQLKPVLFKNQTSTARQIQLKNGPQVGFLPGEFKAVFPELVNKAEILVPSVKSSNRSLIY